MVYSNYLVGQLRDKERHEIHLWSFAVGETVKATRPGDRQQAAILARIIDFSNEIPLVVCDDQLRVLQYRSIDASVLADPERLADKLENMRSGGATRSRYRLRRDASSECSTTSRRCSKPCNTFRGSN